ncbi:winged helix-turn-helix domain-containing protein [Desulfovibrio inopinatus]|uniref:winged helix-turn-helix domain-containing protein n=1 Tax=Desulfovibrio inopinatus TaxID=102109 RepID=UPI000426BCF2|nr:LysR family transcriptional regulator [Desulfovibrio inopinatus]
MEDRQPTIRMRLWLEDGGIFFGMGRVLLLDLIEEHGSLKDAASALGMSYRAAWGKLKATEEALGAKLVETCGSKRNGCRLTEQGRSVREKFREWFALVEQDALQHAKEIFPWEVKSYDEAKEEEHAAQAARSLNTASHAVYMK